MGDNAATPALESEGPASPSASRLKRSVQLSWVALVLAFFCGTVFSHWDSLAAYSWDPEPLYLAAALGIALVRKFLGAVSWSYLVTGVSGTSFRTNAVFHARIYFITNLASYIPGSLWYIPWRIRRSREFGVSASQASVASGVESMMLVLANGLIGIPALALLLTRGEAVDPRLFLSALVLGVVLVHPTSLRFLMRLAGRIFGRTFPVPQLAFRQVLIALVLALTASAVAGATIFCLLRSLQDEVTLESLLFLTSAFAFSWVTGFLTPIAPSGLGVREGLLVYFFQDLVPIEVAAVLAIAIRLLFVLEDLIWAGAARITLQMGR